MKKVAVIKIGGRLFNNVTSIVNGEALIIIKMLYKGGLEVHPYTKILNKDEKIDNTTMHDLLSEHKDINKQNYDALIIINGNANFFGGVEDVQHMNNYYIINNFKGPIFYIVNDPLLVLKQLNIKNKIWRSKYKEKDYIIKRKDFICLTQFYNTDRILELSKDIQIENIEYFPFWKFPMIYKKRLKFDNNRKVDLIYGGTFRGGKRLKKMIQYYFDYPKEFKVEMFGNMKLNLLLKDKKYNNEKLPNITGHINYNEFNDKMSSGLSTVIIGDKTYENATFPQRMAESILANVLTLIDEDLDPNHLFFKRSVLEKFSYVKSRKDVINIVNLVKKQNALKDLTDLQYDHIYEDPKKYCEKFVNLMKKFVK